MQEAAGRLHRMERARMHLAQHGVAQDAGSARTGGRVEWASLVQAGDGRRWVDARGPQRPHRKRSMTAGAGLFNRQDRRFRFSTCQRSGVPCRIVALWTDVAEARRFQLWCCPLASKPELCIGVGRHGSHGPASTSQRTGSPGATAVGLFVTCLVDLMRPSVGFAAVKLLEDAGCIVEVPAQTCCGQPAFNSGDRDTSRAIAERTIAAFARYDYVVAPSGSCAGMIKAHYPELFADDPNLARKADALAAKTYELVSFLVDVMGVTQVDAALRRRRHLSRQLLGPARARRQEPAAAAAGERRRASSSSR